MQRMIDPLDREIIQTVSRTARDGIVPVYPYHVAGRIPVSLSERSVRARMARLAQDGLLMRHSRFGGYGTIDARLLRLQLAMARAERALQEVEALLLEMSNDGVMI